MGLVAVALQQLVHWAQFCLRKERRFPSRWLCTCLALSGLLAQACSGEKASFGGVPQTVRTPQKEEWTPPKVGATLDAVAAGSTRLLGLEAPVAVSGIELQPLKFQLVAQTEENGGGGADKLVYGCIESCPEELEVGLESGVVTWIPGDESEGSYSVTFQARVGDQELRARVAIEVLGQNDAPLAAFPKEFSTSENRVVRIKYTAVDTDNARDLRVRCVQGCPRGIKVDEAAQEIVLDTTYGEAGAYEPVFEVSDGETVVEMPVKIVVEKANRLPEVKALPPQYVDEGKTLAVDLVASDADGDPLLFSCLDGCPGGLSVESDSGSITWTPDYTQGGTYLITFAVADRQETVRRSVEVLVRNVNLAPFFVSGNPAPILETARLSHQVEAGDLDGDPLQFTCVTCPVGVSIDPASGFLSWQTNYTSEGEHQYVISVSDGKLSAQQAGAIMVLHKNAPPVLAAIAPQTVNETQLLSFTLSGPDIDADPLTYSCVSACPAGLVVDAATGAVSWTPSYTQAGVYSVVFGVSDGMLSGQATASITVLNTNAAPELAPLAPVLINETQILSFNLMGSDIDGDVLSYACLAGGPAGLTVNPSTGAVTWATDLADEGLYNLTFAVTDGSLSDSGILQLTVAHENAPPALAAIPAQTASEMVALVFTLAASDLDGDPLNFLCLSACPPGLTVDSGTGTVTWTPSYSQAGTYSPVFAVADGSLQDTKVASLTVLNTNAPPDLFPIVPANVQEGGSLAFALLASDADGDALTYSCVSGCLAGLSVDSASGSVAWTAGFSDAGSYTVTFMVTDGSLSDSEVLNLTVTNQNAAPVLQQPSNQLVMENDLLNYMLVASDIDGDTLTYSCISNCPAGMVVDAASGLLSWQTSYSDAGTYGNIEIRVSDGQLTDSRLMTITVQDVPLQNLSVQFPAGQVQATSSTFSLTSPYSSQQITLISQYTNDTLGFSQITRPPVANSFTQGASGSAQTDLFTQSDSTGLLDLVVVVDNSDSMAEEQLNLSTKLSSLLNSIQNSDWRIGVTTTDPSDPCFRALIKKGDPNVGAAFASAVTAGTAGSNNEMGIRTAVSALKCSSPSWVRADSTVAVLILSDEDNCNTGGFGCPGQPWETQSYLLNYLSSIRTLGSNARVYGLIWHPSQSFA